MMRLSTGRSSLFSFSNSYNHHRKTTELLRHPRQLTNQIPIVVWGDAVVDFVTTFLTKMKDTSPFFLIILDPNGCHQPTTFRCPITRHVKIDMQGE